MKRQIRIIALIAASIFSVSNTLAQTPQPLDRTITTDECRGLAIADESIVFDAHYAPDYQAWRDRPSRGHYRLLFLFWKPWKTYRVLMVSLIKRARCRGARSSHNLLQHGRRGPSTAPENGQS